MKNASLLAVVLAILSACKGGPKLEPKAVADSGFVVDAPADWIVKKDMDHFYSVQSPQGMSGGFVQITTGGSMPASLADAVAHAGCADPTKATSEQTPAGAFFVQCAAKIGTNIESDLDSATCHLTTDKHIDTIAAICKSLRKASAAK